MKGALTTELPRQPQRSESNISYKGTVYIDRHIRVDLSDDEQYVRNMPCYIITPLALFSFTIIWSIAVGGLVGQFGMFRQTQNSQFNYR